MVILKQSRITVGSSPPSCFLHSCLMVFTASLGSPSLFKVLWNVTSLTILSSAIPRKSLMMLRAVPASLYALFKLHFSPGGSTALLCSVDGFWQGQERHLCIILTLHTFLLELSSTLINSLCTYHSIS